MEEIDGNYKDIFYFYQNCWLSRWKTLKRVWDPRQGSAFYMESEGKQHGFSNTQWLSKLVFLVDVTEKKLTIWMRHCKQGCRVGVAKSRGFLGGVGFLTTLEVGFFQPTPEVQLNHLLHRTSNLGILTRTCWNGRTSFETFNETENSCCAPRFPLIGTGICYKIDDSQTSFTLY